MQELEITWGRVIRIWWLFGWRASLGTIVFGFMAGFIVGIAGALVGWPFAMTRIASVALGLGIGVVWGLIVVRMALRKKYREFRIVLVPAREFEAR